MENSAPFLTKDDCCSECHVQAISAADDEMKVCSQCFAMLWHYDYSQDRAAVRAAELTARQIQARAERDRLRQERRAAYLAKPEAEQP